MDRLERAQGCLLGQLAGDSLGSLVEFSSAAEIRRRYPRGLRDLADGGVWDTIAGQPTDDSEMALALAWTLVERDRYDAAAARRAYRAWYDSGPFDCGSTVRAGLLGRPNQESQANGALMRIGPLGIFGAGRTLEEVAAWAREDAALTHPHPVCGDVNALFAVAVALAVGAGPTPAELYAKVADWARELPVTPGVREVVARAAEAPPDDYCRQQGWVLIAFQNALWQLVHAPDAEAGIIDTVMRGGDTDTNGAVCGALLGAAHGAGAIPERWRRLLLGCRPAASDPRVRRPRPEIYWPVHALTLAERLLAAHRRAAGR